MPQTTVQRGAVLSAGLALGALSSVAIGSAPAQAAPSSEVDVKRSKVFVVGDSLTVGTAPYLQRKLGPKVRSLHIDAQVGRFTGTGINKLRSKQARRADIWVVALGTNDAPSAKRTKSNVKKVLRLAGSRKVIWVNVVRPGGYGAVNRVLRQMDKAKKKLTVLDWAAVVRGKSSLLAGDRVHLTSYGYQIRAKLTKRAVVALDTTRDN